MFNASFPKRLRLRKKVEFDRVFAARRSVRDGAIRLFGRMRDDGPTRLGLAVSRRVGNAVVRNRWKRRLREAFRLSHTKLPDRSDLVIIPLCSTPPSVAELRKSLVKLAERIHRQSEGGSP